MRLIIGVIFIFLAFTSGLEKNLGYFILCLFTGLLFFLIDDNKKYNKNNIMSERRVKEEKIQKMVTSPKTNEFVEKIISKKIKTVKIFKSYIVFDNQQIMYDSLNMPDLDDIELEGLAAGIKGKLEYQLDGYYIEKRGIYLRDDLFIGYGIIISKNR